MMRVQAISLGSMVLASALAGDPIQHHEAALLAQGESTFDTAAPAELEVKRTATGHLLVKPIVNGHAAGWFIFDTGAGICVVSTPHVEGLELESTGDIDALGVGGGVSQKTYRAKSLKLGPITLSDHPLMSTDLTFLKPFLEEEIAGVIGYGVLSRCVAELCIGDGEKPARIALFDLERYELARGEWSELLLQERIPAVRAKFEDREGLFHLDTGANGYVTFHQPAVEKWKLLESRTISDAKIGGVGGFVPAKKGTVAWFELGGLRRADVPAIFALDAKGAHGKGGSDGAVGAELLRPFTLVLDYGKGRIAFLKSAP